MGVDRFADTIAAPITPPGRGAVAIVRVSGPKALEIAHLVAPFLPKEITFRHAYYGAFAHQDDGLCILFAAGSSFTGEPSVEFNIHGSPESVKQLLEVCYRSGARAAEPGEFTLRAFMNGQIDLAQAEGIRATVDAATDKQLSMANSLREGNIGRELAPIATNIRKVLTTIEALTDFSEELGEIPLEEKTAPLAEAEQSIERFLALEQLARRIREGVLVVIAGQPNAGKSSLMNALLKYDRAIVTPIPGTTRDSIEEQVSIDGIPVRLVDTAGLRESDDEVEQIGIGRSRDLLNQAHLILYLFDAEKGWDDNDEKVDQEFQNKVIQIATKCDLARSSKGHEISTKTGEGLDSLIELILRQIQCSDSNEPTSLIERHYEVMREVKSLLEESYQAITSQNVPDDLAAVTLRAALRKMGELTGESAPADVLEQIFSQFCIGK
ncbi:MAG: tRNA uridine-5-carboxymethylaminomethyl(34) synthesis GTPase MnmE [Fimbriimonadaceae bacterium]|nr:MAG: tRNA uridine-5-carboxymethylaminomethyl(34) synthesis GTPase MnmE [Fimbriimonadaceae bacterium]